MSFFLLRPFGAQAFSGRIYTYTFYLSFLHFWDVERYSQRPTSRFRHPCRGCKAAWAVSHLRRRWTMQPIRRAAVWCSHRSPSDSMAPRSGLGRPRREDNGWSWVGAPAVFAPVDGCDWSQNNWNSPDYYHTIGIICIILLHGHPFDSALVGSIPLIRTVRAGYTQQDYQTCAESCSTSVEKARANLDARLKEERILLGMMLLPWRPTSLLITWMQVWTPCSGTSSGSNKKNIPKILGKFHHDQLPASWEFPHGGLV